MNYTLLQGDVIEQLKTLPANSVQACVTSPPYWGLRNYGHDGQIGLEETPQAYVAKMVQVFEEVRRVLRDDGCLWLNLGDSYAGSGGAGGDYNEGGLRMGQPKYKNNWRPESDRRNAGELKPKDLCGIPWRVAFALQDAGWWLRSDIIWAKPNPMPESVKDRPTKAHEYIFLLTKSAKYYYDHMAIAEESKYPEDDRGTRAREEHKRFPTGEVNGIRASGVYPTRNARSVWTIATQSYSEAHFATFPTEIPDRCIKASTSSHGCCEKCGAPWERTIEKVERLEPYVYTSIGIPGEGNGRGRRPGAMGNGLQITSLGWQATCDCAAAVIPCTVLDPFAGSGTTIAVALNLGRTGIGIELNPEYIELAHKRICATQPSLIAV